MRKSSWIFIVGLLVVSNTFVACAQGSMDNKKKVAAFQKIEKQLYLFNNERNIVPVQDLAQTRIASVNINFKHSKISDSLFNKYTKVEVIDVSKYKDSTTYNDLEDDLRFFDLVLVSITDQDLAEAKTRNFLQSIASSKDLIISFYGSVNGLQTLESLKHPLIWSKDVSEDAAFLLPQAVFGGLAINQKLDSQISAKFSKGSGYLTKAIRLKYTLPEEVQINATDLVEIDRIAEEAIREKAAPGVVVLVAKGGKVIYNKAFGHHTYDKKRAENVLDIFDLASVTKTTATTPAVMRLVEEGKLKLDSNIGGYIPKARNTPMNNTSVRDVMLHQAGFIPFIPFHNFVKPEDFRRSQVGEYNVKVADSFYVKKSFYADFMWPRMLNSPIKTQGKYVYSDISMYVMKDIVEHISRVPITEYINQNFYAPLGMQFTGYLPCERFSGDQIVPTEEDKSFRKTLLVGYVHDQGAALAGGVAGHAGLFGNANDLAIYNQMLLNKGTYGGKRYFTEETVNTFTSKQSDASRRGLGFDRWDPNVNNKYPSELASNETYGHTGYTGIGVWVDPSRDMIYIFLSNRVNPSVSEKLGNLAIRRRIQDVINKAIDKAE